MGTFTQPDFLPPPDRELAAHFSPFPLLLTLSKRNSLVSCFVPEAEVKFPQLAARELEGAARSLLTGTADGDQHSPLHSSSGDRAQGRSSRATPQLGREDVLHLAVLSTQCGPWLRADKSFNLSTWWVSHLRDFHRTHSASQYHLCRALHPPSLDGSGVSCHSAGSS